MLFTAQLQPPVTLVGSPSLLPTRRYAHQLNEELIINTENINFNRFNYTKVYEKQHPSKPEKKA